MVTIPIRRSTVLIALLALMSAPGSTAAQSPASGNAGDDPALAAVELMNMVPAGVMETCIPYAPSLAGQRAVAQCTLGADTVIYGSFEDLASLATAYTDLTSVVSIEGDATSCAEGPYSGAYRTADGVEAGLVTCTDGDPGLLLAWADATQPGGGPAVTG